VNTNRILALLTVMLASAVLPGCWTTSLHGLYENGDQHLTYDPALGGRWQAEQDSSLVITGDPNDGSYTLEAADEEGRYVYDGHLVQLGPYRFLDVVPVVSYGADGRNQLTEPGYLQVHTVLKVVLEGDSLFLMAPSDHRLCEAASENKLTIGDCESGDFVFTARTRVLQEFFLKHADDLEIFDKRDPDRALHRQTEKKGAAQ
jgi:hypothetical protein